MNWEPLLLYLYLAGFVVLALAVASFNRKMGRWARFALIAFVLAVLFGPSIPTCWSKYCEMIPLPLSLAIFLHGCPCGIENYDIVPGYFLVCWGVFLVFVVFLSTKRTPKL